LEFQKIPITKLFLSLIYFYESNQLLEVYDIHVICIR